MGFRRDFETEQKLVKDEDYVILKYSYVTYMIFWGWADNLRCLIRWFSYWLIRTK